jgi:hypothetical protein
MGRVACGEHHLAPSTGLGGWTDEEIKRTITQGVSRDGRKLKPPMAFAA